MSEPDPSASRICGLSIVRGVAMKMSIRHRVVHGLVASVVWVVAVAPAEAVPSWSRKYDISCRLCHSAWPSLNEYGREFKMRGFRLPGDDEPAEQQIDEFLAFDRGFPLSARFIMRPFDKKRDQPGKIRSFHEIEVFFAGNVSNNMSAWVELEAEDEDGFNTVATQGVFGWHPAEAANVMMGWAPPFWADPFDTLADGGRRMTRSHKGPLDQRFGARERLRSASQWVNYYGYAGNRVFYTAGVSAGGDDPEGTDAKDGFGRVMVQTVPGVYVGGFFLGGTNQTQVVDLDFYRAGFDVQIERDALNVRGLLLHAHDDLVIGGDDNTTVGYAEGFYVFDLAKIPMIVPLVRVDFLDDFTDLTANLNFYVRENVKTYVEWWQNIDTPAGFEKDHRITVQVDFAF